MAVDTNIMNLYFILKTQDVYGLLTKENVKVILKIKP